MKDYQDLIGKIIIAIAIVISGIVVANALSAGFSQQFRFCRKSANSSNSILI